jgi:hypothetical protein
MTEWRVTPEEKTYLRELAQRQAEYAALPIMAERRQQWYDLNDARPGARPPVIVETQTFDRDFLPESVFRGTTDVGRRIERQLLRNLRNHELIDDDKVMPDTFDIGWFVEIDEFGVEIATETVPDHQGVDTGYRFLHPIKNLKEDLHLLQPAQCRVDREGTLAYKAFVEELLGGVLPVAIRSGPYGSAMLTNRVIVLMGMEAFFMAMLDMPEATHQLLAYLRDNCLRVQRWAEAEGLLCLNNGNQQSFGSSYNFTTKLPAPGGDGKVRLGDMWGCANSQESVGVSPEMFHEFCFPYYRDAVAPLGLLYFGCCEPVHPFWEDLRRLPHLKKVSISRWCDQDYVGEALQGTDIVFSRKPDPNFFAVDVELREEAWAEHIRESLRAARGGFMEIIVRDVYTVHGNLEKARRAVEIARGEVERHWG